MVIVYDDNLWSIDGDSPMMIVHGSITIIPFLSIQDKNDQTMCAFWILALGFDFQSLPLDVS